jgi:hypothetical protein
MLTKLEIAFLTVTVLCTLAASLAGLHRSLATPSYYEQSIACSVPAIAFWDVRPSFGEGKALFDQIPQMFYAFPQLPRMESHQANFL